MTFRNRRQTGFTLIELLIVLAILAIIAAIAIPTILGRNRGSAAHAEQELQTHARKLGWDIKGAACAAIDSDNDGYISCTASVQDGDRRVEKAVECASGAPLQRTGGCKVAQPRFDIQGRP